MLTLAVRDTNGQNYVIAPFWIPNQAKWMFRYILLEAVPTLFGNSFCLKVKSFVSDSDEQLCNMIDLAVASTFRNALRLPCGHLKSIFLSM